MTKASYTKSTRRGRPATSSRQLIRCAVASLLPAVSGFAWAQDAAPAANPADSLEEVVVTGKIIFTQDDAFGATKMGLDIKDTPQTVNVVTSDLIDIAGIQSFEDFYKVDASSGVTHNLDGWPRNYYRGFYQQGNNTVRVDGFRMPGNIELDLAMFDRFEVIKGPTSTLYGQNNVGGALNAVSKLPQNKFAAELMAEAAQYDQYRMDADVTGALFGSDKWSFRLIGAYQEADSFIDFVRDDRQLASAAVQYSPSDNTRFTLRYVHQKNEGAYHYGSILQLAGDGTEDSFTRVQNEGLKIADLPRSRYFGMPWNNNEKSADFLQLQADHEFANQWRLRVHAQYSTVDEQGDNFWVGGPYDQNGEGDFMWRYGGSNEHELYGTEINLFGGFEAFGREHTLFFGIDYSDLRDNSLTAGAFAEGFENSVFNIFDPDYSVVPPPSSFAEDYGYFYFFDTDTKLFGATVQLIAKATDRLSVILGGRFSQDEVDDIGSFGYSPDEAPTGFRFTDVHETAEKFTTQIGATYAITEAVNLYASYGQTFEPQFGNEFVGFDSEGNPIGKPIDPQEGTSYEIGAKAELAADLFLSVAAFDIARTNISITDIDPDHPPDFQIPLGEQRSRGVELALQGRLLPQLSINLSAARLDSEYQDGPLRGLQAANAPKFGFTVFGTYELLEGPMQGLGFGLGVVHKRGNKGFDAQWTEAAGRPITFDFGDFTEVDAQVFYEKGPWNLTLMVTNLLNDKYYSQTFEELWWSTNVNPPSTVRARVAYKF
jgi:iron complex outermembrane receptor protein